MVVAVATAVATARAVAASPCLDVPGGGALTVAGVGRVVFAELATDRARDAATFGGGVCVAVDGGEVVVRTERLEVTGLDGALRLAAERVRVEVPGWTLTADRLEGGAGWAELRTATMAGVDAIGEADRLRLDLETGHLEAEALRLATESVRLDAAHARFDGAVLRTESARVTTCDCDPSDAPLRLDADAARFHLADESLRLEGGALVVSGTRWALPDPVVLDASVLEDLRFPFGLAPDPDRAGAWRARLDVADAAPGVDVAWALAAGGSAPPWFAAALAAADGAARLRADLTTDGVAVEVAGAAALGAGWRLEARQRFEAGALDEPFRDTAVRVARPLAVPGGSGAFGATVALSGQQVGGRDVAAPRLGVDARASWSARNVVGSPTLVLAGGATTYPGLATSQAWASVQPSVALRLGSWRLDATHLGRWVAGGSPFTARVDRVAPLQRTTLDVAWSDADGVGGPSVALAVRYRWDLDPLRPGRPVGWEALTAQLTWSVPAGAGRLSVDVRTAWAGRLDPRPGRDAFATATVAWSDARWEVGARATHGLRPGDGWREWTLFGAAPFATSPEWWWRPYLAVDVLAFAGGAGPWLRGHGLEVAWTGCCGTLELGYRADEGRATTTHVAFRLPVRDLGPERLADAR